MLPTLQTPCSVSRCVGRDNFMHTLVSVRLVRAVMLAAMHVKGLIQRFRSTGLVRLVGAGRRVLHERASDLRGWISLRTLALILRQQRPCS